MKTSMIPMAALLVAVVGCEPLSKRVDALDSSLWEQSEWISVADAPVFSGQVKDGARAADGTSWFVRDIENEGEVKSAVWMTTGLGVYEIYVNGKSVGSDDALKPGFTHVKKTRRSFTYDVTDCLKKDKGEKNFFAAEVSAGWWRDKIVNFAGKKSAFRAVLQVTYADGSVKVYGTKADEWKAAIGGPVKHAAIFDGEEYDARVVPPYFGGEAFRKAERNDEFKGEILPSEGGEICRRMDKALEPVEAYVWKGVDGADEANKIFGRVHKLRNVSFDGKTPVALAKGETLVIDFGQNCAAVPAFVFKAIEGTVLTCLPAEMLNDANGERSRGNDGPGGSVYRENLRVPSLGMRAVYTFGNGKDGPNTVENGFSFYVPVFTFFGYRYASITATDDVEFLVVGSIPVTSIKKKMELGKIETGVADVNKLISNVYWGQLSNYLSVPTDCPQRNERLGWTADTQVFTEAGSFNADTSSFFRKWMRDLCDNQHALCGFPGVAPLAQYGNEPMRIGWADVGVITPYQVWKQFGDTKLVADNWAAMEKFVARVNETKYDYEATKGENGGYQWADWVGYEDLESCSGKAWKNKALRPEAKLYWNYLGACYWRWDAQMMEAMAAAVGKDAAKYAKMAEEAKEYLKKNFFSPEDGLLVEPMRGMQTPALFALKLGLVEEDAKAKTIEALKRNFADHGDCLQTGFLGTSILMDTLTENGMSDIAYTLLLQHKNPSWLYSVDQGATTIWERWNSYTKEKGFGPVGMNSFNHYAYGAVLAWMYKSMAGIAADPKAPGFKNIIMAPKPDVRIGFVKAEYKSAAGLIKSHWRYESTHADLGMKWVWDFTIPEGATADVTLPGETSSKRYTAGTYHIVKDL
ncbi:MAG: family 78 glycoside hydrolase catalytic domain [Kiritimatiellae bacterium]|nr:family 78 glycoside hydrolase catalytic domain [Kiritimatiellia bacterium]